MRLFRRTIVVLCMCVHIMPSYAQSNNIKQNTLDQAIDTLDSLEAERQKVEGNQAEIQNLIDQIEKDRRILNERLISLAKTIQDIEANAISLERELTTLKLKEADLIQDLTLRRQSMSQILASLQRLGKKPPPAIIVKPENVLNAVRASQLIGSIVPPLQFEAELLSFDLSEVQRIKEETNKKTAELKQILTDLSLEKEQMSALIDDKRQQSNQKTEELSETKKRIQAIAKEAKSIEDLVSKVEREIKLQAKIAKAQSEDQSLKPLPNFGDPNRTRPALPFIQTKGRVPLPVSGAIIGKYGQEDNVFGELTGIQIATRNGATVISPADGWVSYAGNYRRYGNVVIINTGDNHLILLAGLEKVNVVEKDFVLAGEPIGQMGSKKYVSASSLRGNNDTPILYVEFRSAGKPINPQPWWKKE